MPKLPRLTPQKAEKLLVDAGYRLARTKDSHRIYVKEKRRIVIPFHKGKILHPKIAKLVLRSIEHP